MLKGLLSVFLARLPLGRLTHDVYNISDRLNTASMMT